VSGISRFGFPYSVCHGERTGRVFRRRTVGAVVLLALIPAAVAIPALAALALVGAVCSSAVAYEVLRYRDARVRVRHAELAA
jgi:hypothetical protein